VSPGTRLALREPPRNPSAGSRSDRSASPIPWNQDQAVPARRLLHDSCGTEWWYEINMKAIQALFDERLLAALDATEEVQRRGRSAVLRRAAAEYLRRSRSRFIAEQYRRAYSGREPDIREELSGWGTEGTWPAE